MIRSPFLLPAGRVHFDRKVHYDARRQAQLAGCVPRLCPCWATTSCPVLLMTGDSFSS